MHNVGFDMLWATIGLLCYIIFSAYMASNNRQHMRDNPMMGLLLLAAALVLGPISLFLFFVYALTVGATGELNVRFKPTEKIRN